MWPEKGVGMLKHWSEKQVGGGGGGWNVARKGLGGGETLARRRGLWWIMARKRGGRGGNIVWPEKRVGGETFFGLKRGWGVKHSLAWKEGGGWNILWPEKRGGGWNIAWPEKGGGVVKGAAWKVLARITYSQKMAM